MATVGPNYPGTTASLSNAGSSESAENWVNPGNIVSDNATEATITAATYDSPDISELLVASNFALNIPVSSTINGITVEVDRRSIIASSGVDNRVQLATGTTFASLVGSNKATATVWPSSTGVATYGGSADTWSASLTPAQVNATGFAVMLSAKANIANADIGVDYIRVTITYTLVPVVLTPPTATLVTATFAPAVGTDPKLVTPTTASLATATFAPTATVAAGPVDIPAATTDNYIDGFNSFYPPTTLTVEDAGDTIIQVGQRFNTPNYFTFEAFLEFDTSAYGSASAAALKLTVNLDSSTTDFTTNVYAFDWGGGTLTTGDWRTAAQLGSLTLVAHKTSVGITDGSTYTFDDDALLANINFGGTTRFVLASDRFAAGTTPTTDERIWWESANTVAGSAARPTLTLTGAGAAADPKTATPTTAALTLTTYAPWVLPVDIVASAADGYVDANSGSYPPASGSTADTSSTFFDVGQLVVGSYDVWQAFISFDTTGLALGAVGGASLLLNCGGDNSTAAEFDVEASVYDWGSSVTTGDYRSPSQLSALTKVAHLSTVGGLTTGTTYTFSDDALAANLNAAGPTRLILASSRNRAGTTPPGVEYVRFESADNATASKRPVLRLLGPASLNVTVTPPTASLTLATFAPVVTFPNPQLVTPTTVALLIGNFAPTVTASNHQVATPTTASLTTATFAPTVSASDHQVATPSTASLATATFAPTVTATGGAPVTVTAGVLALTTATFAPSAAATANQLVTAGIANIGIATFAPTVVNPVSVTPANASLTLTAFAPTSSTSDHKTVTPTTAAVLVAPFAPTVTASNHQIASVGLTALTLATFAPLVRLQVTPSSAALTTATFAPTVVLPVTVTATTAALLAGTYAPVVTFTAHQTLVPTTAVLTLATFAPSVGVSLAGAVIVPSAALSLSTYAPTVSDHRLVTPATATLNVAPFAPTVAVSANQRVVPTFLNVVLTTFAASVGNPITATPTTLALHPTGNNPTVTASANQTASVGAAGLLLTTFAPSAAATNPVTVTPTTQPLATAQFAPLVDVTAHIVAVPPLAALSTATFAPDVAFTADFVATPAVLNLVLTRLPPHVVVPTPGHHLDITLSMSAMGVDNAVASGAPSLSMDEPLVMVLSRE